MSMKIWSSALSIKVSAAKHQLAEWNSNSDVGAMCQAQLLTDHCCFNYQMLSATIVAVSMRSVNLGYHGVKYEKCEKLWLFLERLGYMCGQIRMIKMLFQCDICLICEEACDLPWMNTKFMTFRCGIVTWLGFAWSMVRWKLGSFWGVTRWKHCEGAWWQVCYFGYVGWS